jgi:hypothetical protein
LYVNKYINYSSPIYIDEEVNTIFPAVVIPVGVDD